MTPEELIAVIEALPGVQLDTWWHTETGEIDPSKVFVAVRCDMTPMSGRGFEIQIERSGHGDPDRGCVSPDR